MTSNEITPYIDFSGFPAETDNETKRILQELQADVTDSNAYIASEIGASLRSKIDSGEIGDNDYTTQVKFRFKAFDSIIKDKAPWISKSHSSTSGKQYIAKEDEFGVDSIREAFGNLDIPPSFSTELDKVVKSFVDGIAAGSSSIDTSRYWALFTYYRYIEAPKSIKAQLKTVALSATASTFFSTITGKKIDSKCQLTVTEFDFNQQAFKDAKDVRDKQEIETSERLLDSAVINVSP